MNILNKLKTVFILGSFVVVAGTGLLYAREKIFAVTGAPYGAFTVAIYPCPCSGPLLLLNIAPGFIGPIPSAYQATYVPGSQIYGYWTLGAPGVWALGFGAPPFPCLWFAPHSGCFPVGAPIMLLEPFSGSSISI